MILEKHHYGVLSASDGPEALAIFAQQMQSIRLVLTDISMPYMDGSALARALLPVAYCCDGARNGGEHAFAAEALTRRLKVIGLVA